MIADFLRALHAFSSLIREQKRRFTRLHDVRIAGKNRSFRLGFSRVIENRKRSPVKIRIDLADVFKPREHIAVKTILKQFDRRIRLLLHDKITLCQRSASRQPQHQRENHADRFLHIIHSLCASATFILMGDSIPMATPFLWATKKAALLRMPP